MDEGPGGPFGGPGGPMDGPFGGPGPMEGQLEPPFGRQFDRGNDNFDE